MKYLRKIYLANIPKTINIEIYLITENPNNNSSLEYKTDNTHLSLRTAEWGRQKKRKVIKPINDEKNH